LLAWFDRHGRADLPWRSTRDPWAVLVSEVMLQQTQVERALARYGPFLAQFPSAPACAAASPSAVIDRWQGLGYNRRALNLWRAAVVVSAEHGGRFPRERAALQALPGVGPYTARAVQAFAFECDVGVVDTNVARVLARRTGRPLGRAEVQQLADQSVPPAAGWAWNQAMLDLGRTVCTARAPRCAVCPVQTGCRWHERGAPLPDPAVGSAGVSKGQSRFAGSDRQGRGRLVDALRDGPVPRAALAATMGWPGDEHRAERVAATLLADGLVHLDGGTYRLPA
jgi:A/G-specific adenine glycosylase